jgi:hypothetical protein
MTRLLLLWWLGSFPSFMLGKEKRPATHAAAAVSRSRTS